MLPVLRRQSDLMSNMFRDFDSLFEWPRTALTHSRWATYEDANGYVLEVDVPSGVKTEEIRAEVSEGTLRITIPRPAAKQVPITEVVEGKSEGRTDDQEGD